MALADLVRMEAQLQLVQMVLQIPATAAAVVLAPQVHQAAVDMVELDLSSSTTPRAYS